MRSAQRNVVTTALVVIMGLPNLAIAAYVTGSEYVNYLRQSPAYTVGADAYGPFEWNVRYTRSFDGTQFRKDVQVGFAFDAALNFTEEQKLAYRVAAETNIEQTWNGRYYIEDTATHTYFPLLVDVTLIGPIDQTVTVKATRGASDPVYDMTHWYVDQDTRSYQAHEFGHMLGLFDEYLGGALNQVPDPLLSADGLMGLGALSTTPVMYARYYQQYLDFMNSLNPGGSFRLVPEPSSLWLAVAAILLLGLARSRGALPAG